MYIVCVSVWPIIQYTLIAMMILRGNDERNTYLRDSDSSDT